MSIVPRRFRSALCLGGLLILTALLRCWNAGDVFVDGKVFFVDPDCYSRMTRVQRVAAHPGTAVHTHEFENWPDGTRPHTTAPFDALTAALSWGFRPFSENRRSETGGRKEKGDAAAAALGEGASQPGGMGLSPELDPASSSNPVNLAGAWISVLLGVATAGFLWGWAGRLKLRYRTPLIFLFATSPILVHATMLGRPDHQSLLVLCMAVALGAEAALLARPRPSPAWVRAWGIASGAGWGTGLWVSLYEPAFLMAGAFLLLLILKPRVLVARERRAGWLVFAAILLLAACVDGWHSPIPDPVILKYFPNWSRTIGELNSVPPFSAVMLRWTLALLPLTPVLLLLASRWGRGRGRTVPDEERAGEQTGEEGEEGEAGDGRNRSALFWLGMLAAVFALTCWQARWGYFLGLVFAMSLPLQLSVFPKRWMAYALFVLALWPVARDWEDRLGLSPGPAGTGGGEFAMRAERRMDNLALHDVALHLRGRRLLPILAPWWQSPALAYWSEQPCVAGSSHESLPGIVDSALFYTSTDPAEADKILARRKVAVVVAYDPGRVLETSAIILGQPAGEVSEKALGFLLYTRPHSPPPGLELIHMNRAFRVFLRPEGVDETVLPSAERF